MPGPRKRSGRPAGVLPDTLQEMMSQAMAQKEDFILAVEHDPETGLCRAHAFTGKYVSDCMLRKLTGLAESQRDEGSRMITGEWQ
jgi:hypothetical protein